jgi:hypothetical protein
MVTRHRGHDSQRLQLQQTLKPGENLQMPMRGHILVHWPWRQAPDQGMNQLLLQPVHRLAVNERPRPNFRCKDGDLMEVEQLPASRRRRLPSPDKVRNGKPGSAQRTAISDQVLGRQPDGAPAAGAVGSCMHTLTRAESDDLARSHPDPAPDRRRSTAHRQRDQNRVCGHRDKGDPRQVLLGGQ